MIYTVTPNPALDLGGIVDEIIPNEKIYVHDETRFPGGNGINAARIIKTLGVPVTATGFVGGGAGDEIKSLLAAERVHNEFIEIRGHTRVSVTVSNKKTGLQTRLSFPGPVIRAQEIKALFALLSKSAPTDLWVIGGSLPPGFSILSLLTLIRKAKERGVLCIVDVPGKYLKALVNEGALFIKPNLVEFQELVGRKIKTRSEVVKAAKKFTSTIPLVCVSSVEGGAVLVTHQAAWFGMGPRVKILSHVGAGDSMVGAISVELQKRRSFIQQNRFDYGDVLLRWGLAAAVATLTTPGTTLGSRAQIQRYYSKVRVERIE